MSMTDDERALLADAPVAVFVLVAGADGRADAKEHARFAELLQASKAPDSPLLGELLLLTAERADARLDALDASEAEALLAEVGSLAGRVLNEADCATYKRGLSFIAERVASASGGGVLGLRNSTAAAERAAIDRVLALLG